MLLGKVLVTLSCFLSAMGALSIMLSYFLFPDMRRKRGRLLLVFLSITDFGSALAYMWAGLSNLKQGTAACHVQALLGIYFPVASFLWTDCIGVFLYRYMQGKRDISFVPYHIVCWGLPAVMCAVVAGFGRDGFYPAGTTGGWCWIRQGAGSMVPWILIGGKGVEWTSIFLVFVFYFLVWHQNKNRLALTKDRQSLLRSDDHNRNGMIVATSGSGGGSDTSGHASGGGRGHGHRRAKSGGKELHAVGDPTPDGHINEFMRKLVLVPVVFFLARVFGDVNIIRTVSDPKAEPIVWLGLLQGFCDPSQGFFNGIIFVGFSRDVRELYSKMFSGWMARLPLPMRVAVSRLCWLLSCGHCCRRCCCKPAGAPPRKLSVRSMYGSAGQTGADESVERWDFT